MLSKTKALLSKSSFIIFLFFALPFIPLADLYSQPSQPNPDSIPFAPAVNYPAGDGPVSAFCADLDGDGDLDLAVPNFYSDSVSILKNNGDGTYQSVVNYGVGDEPHSVFCADLDGDSDLDLAVANRNSYNVSILKNNGDGTFQTKVDYYAGDGPHSVFCADLDGDTALDLTVANANNNSNGVSILKNNGDGTFQSAVSYGAGENGSYSVFCADLDGDTALNLAVANNNSNSVSILKNNGDGTFQSAVNYGVGDAPLSVFCADLDGDGDLDLAVANCLSDNVSIFKNNGDGTFETKVDYGVGDWPHSVFCADLDGDGDLDLAVANSESDSVSILLNLSNLARPDSFSLISPSSEDSIKTTDYLIWQKAIDPDPNDTVRYDLYLSRSVVFNPDSTDTQLSLLDTTFTESFTAGIWYWKVKAYDKWGATRWSNQTWSFWVLSPPDPYSLITPPNGEFVLMPVTFNWQTSRDVDPNDIVRYDLYLSRSVVFNPNPESTVVHDSLSDTTSVDSLDGGSWYWKVKAFDRWNLETWSNETWSFWVCSSPYSFSLLSPHNLDSVSTPVNFAWQGAFDPDPDDTVRYDLYLSRNIVFNPYVVYANLLDTTLTDSLTTKLWYWKVKAYDKWGAVRWSDQPWCFYVYLCGDCNADGVVNSADVSYLINYLFVGGPAPVPWKAGNVNGDGTINSADVSYIINYLFVGGPRPCG